MSAALVVVLLLQPVLDEAGPMRLVAADVGDAEVVWSLDGVEVARTHDREAAVVDVAAGSHELRAASTASGGWTALARPDGVGDGATFVQGWVAVHEATDATTGGLAPASSGAPEQRGWDLPALSLMLGAGALLLAAWPGRSGLEALRRLRRR